MSTLIIQTEDESAVAEILAFVKQMKAVKSFSIETLEKTLSADDWVKPGRKATAEELEELASILDETNSFKDIDEVFAKAIESIKK